MSLVMISSSHPLHLGPVYRVAGQAAGAVAHGHQDRSRPSWTHPRKRGGTKTTPRRRLICTRSNKSPMCRDLSICASHAGRTRTASRVEGGREEKLCIGKTPCLCFLLLPSKPPDWRRRHIPGLLRDGSRSSRDNEEIPFLVGGVRPSVVSLFFFVCVCVSSGMSLTAHTLPPLKLV